MLESPPTGPALRPTATDPVWRQPSAVRLPPALDYGATASLRRLFYSSLMAPWPDVVADLSDVSFMDCAGLAVLLQVNAGLPVRMRLVNCPRSVTELLLLTGTYDSFTIG